MRKAPIKAVQELIGHSTVMMTERYAHLSPDVWRELTEVRQGEGRHDSPTGL